MKGLHPNTLDETVIRYLKFMGTMKTTKVILDTYKEGPLAGFQNGDRKYTVEFKAGLVVGSTHVIDGQKVNFNFPGQKRSCFRCLRVFHDCPGKGVVRDCEAALGKGRDFWNQMGC